MNEELTVAIEELRQRPSTRIWFIPVKLSDVDVPARMIGGGETLRDLQHVDLTSNWKQGVAAIATIASSGQPRLDPGTGQRIPVAAGAEVQTVTLSFELRKLTFAVESIDDSRNMVAWFDQLSMIFQEVARRHDGFASSLSRNGGEMYFPVSADARLSTCIATAAKASFVLQNAMTLHLNELRRHLRLDSLLLGAAIGIDVSQTHWGVGARNNSIVIGRGVATAGRLSDSAVAGAITLTNIAYKFMPARDRRCFRASPFVTKEFGAEMQIHVWQATAPSHPRSAAVLEARDIVSEVYGAPAKGGQKRSRNTTRK